MEIVVRKDLLVGTVSYGLELLSTALFKTKDHQHLVSMMQDHLTHPQGVFLENEALGDLAQASRRSEEPSERDFKQHRRDPLPFQGDVESDPNGVHPPLAWTLLWSGTYSNLYGYYVCDEIRSWGYVMWDAARLDAVDVKEVLVRQQEEDLGRDPRNDSLMMPASIVNHVPN